MLFWFGLTEDWLSATLGAGYAKGLTTRYIPLTNDVYDALWKRKKLNGPVFYTTARNKNFDYWTLYGIMKVACKKSKIEAGRHPYA